jgi:hypothetical protein
MVVIDGHATYYTFNCIVFRVCNFVFRQRRTTAAARWIIASISRKFALNIARTGERRKDRSARQGGAICRV